MTALKILIAENELLIAENIASVLIDAGYEVPAMITRGEELEEAVLRCDPDLLIMDIKLDGKMDGIIAVKRLASSVNIPFIYLTDIDNKLTMDRANGTNPSAYLLKPFNDRQLLASVHNAIRNFSNRISASNHLKTETEELHDIKGALFVANKNGNLEKIYPEQMCYVEASGNYTYLHMAGGKKYTLTSSMNRVIMRLNNPAIIRVHRSYAVNADRVDTIKGNILVVDGNEIHVGDTYRGEVFKYFPFLK